MDRREHSDLIIAPSLLAADFGHLAEAVAQVEEGGAEWLHLDIMDGHFVPNISYGPMVVAAVRKMTSLYLDVHLMISDPDAYIDAFAEAGADGITVHAEAARHLHRTVQRIKSLGLKAGVALNPATPWEQVRWVLPATDLLLIMTVNPGFGGQAFIPEMLAKIEEVRRWCGDEGLDIPVQVDGGIDEATAPGAAAAGARVLVAGTALFGQPDPARAVENLRRAAVTARQG